MKKSERGYLGIEKERKLNSGQKNAFLVPLGDHEYESLVLQSIKENSILKDLIRKRREGDQR